MERRRLLDINGIPFADDLIFYAPLTQGDTTDHISGQGVTIINNAIMTWDAQQNAYIFNARNLSNWYCSPFSWGSLNLGLFTNGMNINDIDYTIYTICKVVTANNGIAYSRHIPSVAYVYYNGKYGYYPVSRGGFFGELTIDGSWHEYVFTVNNGDMKFYRDKQLAQISQMVVTLSNMTYEDGNNHLSIYTSYGSSGNAGSAYIKDIRLYNRALTDAEIAQL